MDRCRAPAAAMPDHGDDPDELGVFAAERYFYGDDALWCERSSSSLSSAFRTAGTLDHDRSVVPTPTAATSSSEASWNSRSALLPSIDPPPPAEKSRAAAAVATPAAGAEPASGAESRRAGHGHNRRASSSNLRRWLLGVAGCACAARGDGEESVSDADEMEAGSDGGVPGAGGKKCNNGESEVFLKGAEIQEIAAVTVRPGSGRWLLEGDRALAGREPAAFLPMEIAGHGHRRGANSVELPRTIMHPDPDEWRRVKSLEKSRPPLRDEGALGLATQSSAFTIVAGNTSGGGSDGDGDGEDDDAAPSELGCAYPPSEASVVWSVVTADDGAASGVFSSAASGYYHHHHYFDYGGEDSASRHAAAAAKSDRRRRMSGGITAASSSLLTCMSQKAVDAVGPAALSVHRPEAETAAVARLGAAASSRNGHGGGYQDVVRRRVGR